MFGSPMGVTRSQLPWLLTKPAVVLVRLTAPVA